LVLVDLGDFRDDLKGERVAGRVEDGRLKPYATRSEIVTRGLSHVAAPVVYVDNPWEAFSLQIQGSGRVRLPGGEMIRVNYDGQNGHPYTAIGRELIRRGAIRREDLSMQTIRKWLEANPKQADGVMNLNASYVFFKEESAGDPAQGAPGAMSVPLHPERSLAIDLRYHALGAPMWVDATRPADKDGETPETFRHLLIAHDTGGAIRGPVRGDVYWGAGARPEELAGRMANRGRLVVLLPRELAAKVPSGN
jgi:membrane-bound lytic murein transglycosylase A